MNGKVRLAAAVLVAAFLLTPTVAWAIEYPSAPKVDAGKRGTSRNWSGYAVATSLSSPEREAAEKVTGKWVVPAVTGSANAYSATWVGIDGYNSKTVEQIGTSQDFVGGSADYYAWYEMYPKRAIRIVGLPLHPGDQIYAEVEYLGSRRFELTIANQTEESTFTTFQKSNGRRTSAEWVEEAPWSGGTLPLANFGTVSFTGCGVRLNGHSGPIDDGAWEYDPITMVNAGGSPIATPSALSGGGTSFSVTWKGH